MVAGATHWATAAVTVVVHAVRMGMLRRSPALTDAERSLPGNTPPPTVATSGRRVFAGSSVTLAGRPVTLSPAWW